MEDSTAQSSNRDDMHIISKTTKTRSKLGGGRVDWYTLSDGRVLTFNQLLEECGLTRGTLSWRLVHYGMTDKRVLLPPRDKRRKPGKKEYNHKFDRASVCIKDRVCCVNYGKCQEERIMQKKWSKPNGDCYVRDEPRYYGERRSIMSGNVVAW